MDNNKIIKKRSGSNGGSSDNRIEVKEIDSTISEQSHPYKQQQQNHPLNSTFGSMTSSNSCNSIVMEPPSNRFNYYNSDSISSLNRSNSLLHKSSSSRGFTRYNHQQQQQIMTHSCLSPSNSVSSASEFFIIQDLVEIETTPSVLSSSIPPPQSSQIQPNILKRTTNKYENYTARRINSQPKVSDLTSPSLSIDQNSKMKQSINNNDSTIESLSSSHKLISNEIVDILPDKTKDYKYDIQQGPIDLNNKHQQHIHRINHHFHHKHQHHHPYHHHSHHSLKHQDSVTNSTTSDLSPYIPTSLIDTSLNNLTITDSNIINKSKKEIKKELKIEKELNEAIVQQQQIDSQKKKKKKNKRKKKSQKQIHLEHKKNSQGETIYKGHPSWLLMRTIQTGLVNCISKTSNEFDNKGNNGTNISENFADHLFESKKYTLPIIEEHPGYTFTFKDYCPHVFYRLRENANIDNFSYVYSICQSWNEISTPGKSGSVFFFSADNQYVLKTIPKREAKLLRQLLPEYYEHVKRNPNTLLPKFFGLHRVKPKNGSQVRFLVMKNLFSTEKLITQRFDLKGSTVGRELGPEEAKKKNPTLKDLDFRRMGTIIHLGPERKKLFMHQLNEDCKFLVRLNIMDYSLLIGLHKKSDLVYDYDDIDTTTSDGTDDNDENDDGDGQEQEEEEVFTTEDEEDKDNYDSELSKSTEDQPNNSNINHPSYRRHQKKISSLSETQSYLSHLHNTNPLSNSNVSSPNNNSPTLGSNNQTNSNINTEDKEEDYMKPVDLPTLPPVLKDEPEKDFIPMKPKISIFEHDKGGMKGLDQDGNTFGEYYFIGVIDILMLYSLRKQIEHTYKSLFNKGEVSSVDPVEYAARFLNFISENIK